jgi:two-component system, OmpR family, phosphate regulon sensor histidine kinase PhoR
VKRRTLAKLLAIFLGLILLTTLLVDLSVRRVFQKTLEAEIERALISKAKLIADDVNALPSEQMAGLVESRASSAQSRITIIDGSGTVLADSEANPGAMENHAARAEVAAALRGETGIARRRSVTTNEPYLYAAVPANVGAVRLAYPLAEIEKAVALAQRNLILASLVVLPLVIFLALWIAHSITQRLDRVTRFAEQVAAGNFDARIQDSARDELSRAADALNRTAERLKWSFQAEITSRKQLETLLDSMQEAVIAVGPDSRVRWLNGRMKTLISKDVQLGSSLVELTRNPDLLNAFRATLESGEAAQARIQSFVPGRSFLATIAPVADQGAVAVLHETTAIEQAEKTRRDFIANVSHELRTPLTSIRGYAETTLDGHLDASVRQFMDIIHKNTMRMIRLTEDLLVLARVESGEESFRLESVSVAQLMQDVRESFREMATQRGYSLQVETAPRGQVLVDADKILQVFTNLFDNAMKYATPGTTISVGARNAGNMIEFFVSDSGSGIPSEHLPRLFERFYRVDKARSLESGGTGLGLAIVKHIVLKHNGQVRVESRVNQGSTFYFTLPAAESSPKVTA